MLITFDGKIPIYIQIINHIKKDIVTGKLKGGDKMPSVRDMAERTRVNPNTIQRVYQELEREGITYTLRGTGSFVTEDTSIIQRMQLEMSQEIIKDFVKGMRGLGLSRDKMIAMLREYLEDDKSGHNT